MPANQKYPDQDVLTAYRQANNNLTHAAKLLGASRQTIANTLERLGLRVAAPRKNKRVAIDKDFLIALYQGQKLSAAEIGRLLAVSAAAVRDQMVRHGIPRRKVGSSPGSKNPAWKGGRRMDKTGYVLVHCPDHPNADSHGMIREHRLVMSQVLDRPLLPDEVVHHIDGNKENNDPANLELFDRNHLHLRHELAGRKPNWTPDGLDRIRAGAQKGVQNSLKTAWTDERREKARQRTIARQSRGEFGVRQWTAETHRLASEMAKKRQWVRRPDGSFERPLPPDPAREDG